MVFARIFQACPHIPAQTSTKQQSLKHCMPSSTYSRISLGAVLSWMMLPSSSTTGLPLGTRRLLLLGPSGFWGGVSHVPLVEESARCHTNPSDCEGGEGKGSARNREQVDKAIRSIILGATTRTQYADVCTISCLWALVNAEPYRAVLR